MIVAVSLENLQILEGKTASSASDVIGSNTLDKDSESINEIVKQASGMFSLIGTGIEIYEIIKKQMLTYEDRAYDSLFRIILYALKNP